MARRASPTARLDCDDGHRALIGCAATWRARWRAGGAGRCCAPTRVAERAQALAAEVGGEALASERARSPSAPISSCSATSRPSSRRRRRAKSAPHAKAVASILAATPLADLQGRLPRSSRSTASSPRCRSRCARARSCRPRIRRPGRRRTDARRSASCSRELGTLVVLPDALVDVAMGLMSCAPAYVALVAEAQIDAGVRRGHPGRPGRRAGRADARRDRGAAAPPRQRHAGGPPRGHLAGRRHRTRPGRAGARRAEGGVQRRARRGRCAARRPADDRSPPHAREIADYSRR